MSYSLSEATESLVDIKLGKIARFDAGTQNFYKSLILSIKMLKKPVMIYGDPGLMLSIMRLNGISVEHDPSMNFKPSSTFFQVVFVMNNALTYEQRAAMHYDDVSGVEVLVWQIPDYCRQGNFEYQQALVQVRLRMQIEIPMLTKWKISNEKELKIVWEKYEVPFVFKRESVNEAVLTLKALFLQEQEDRVQKSLIRNLEATRVLVPHETRVEPRIINEPQINVLRLVEDGFAEDDEGTVDSEYMFDEVEIVTPAQIPGIPVFKPKPTAGAVFIKPKGPVIQVATAERFIDANFSTTARYNKSGDTQELLEIATMTRAKNPIKVYTDHHCNIEIPHAYRVPTRKTLYLENKDANGCIVRYETLDGCEITCCKKKHVAKAYLMGR